MQRGSSPAQSAAWQHCASRLGKPGVQVAGPQPAFLPPFLTPPLPPAWRRVKGDPFVEIEFDNKQVCSFSCESAWPRDPGRQIGPPLPARTPCQCSAVPRRVMAAYGSMQCPRLLPACLHLLPGMLRACLTDGWGNVRQATCGAHRRSGGPDRRAPRRPVAAAAARSGARPKRGKLVGPCGHATLCRLHTCGPHPPPGVLRAGHAH